MKKEKCYFYSEFHDMGASIPCCSLHEGLGVCPCEDCDKFLSRADAFDIVLNHIKGEERPKGHWIKEVDFGNCVHYVCSECKNEGEKDYCPNCGAEMVDPQESEE